MGRKASDVGFLGGLDFAVRQGLTQSQVAERCVLSRQRHFAFAYFEK
jgi:hypothetical protein